MDNISRHISYREATFSITALRKNIDNTPGENELDNMQFIAETVFELLRILLGDRPITISSFFRSRELNEEVGGDPGSQHMCNNFSAAMDLDNDNSRRGPTNRQIFEAIRDNMHFDQLINEFPDAMGNPSWVHVSIRNDDLSKNRREVLVSQWVNGKRLYLKA